MKAVHLLPALWGLGNLLVLALAVSGEGSSSSSHLGLDDWDMSRPMNGISFERAKARSDPTPDHPAVRYSRLRNLKATSSDHDSKRKGGSPSALERHIRTTTTQGRASPGGNSTAKFQNITAVGDYSTQYAIQCGWDGVPVWLLFDTGSADTWAAQSGFRCVDSINNLHPEVACAFGGPLIQDFGHGRVDDLHFYLRYGSDEVVWGPMGYSDISCGGLTVTRQTVGLANHTYWHGNNVTAGILGLAYPSITSAYYGAIGDEREFNSQTYTPFLTHAIAQGSIGPSFSVAIQKNSSDGILAWGGLPPMAVGSGPVASTDLIIANLIDQAETGWRYSFYTILPDGLKWGQTSNSARYPYIVDTGTTMMYLPPPLAEAVAQSFQPPAQYLYQWGAYFAPCDAVPPHFAVTIGNVDIWINPADMIYRDLVDPLTGFCAVAVASGGPGPYILGDAFLQNVVAVFDVGGAQMRFYPRE